MATKQFTPLLGKRMRATVLDSCARFPAPTTVESVAVTSGFVTVSLSAEIESGSEILKKRADGALCVNEMTDPIFKRLNVEAEFCGVDPGFLSVVSNAVQYEDYAGDINGIKIAEGSISNRFALDLWTGLSGAVCDDEVEEPSGYLLLPHVHGGNIGDIEVAGEDTINFTITGAFTRGGNAWGRGPYNVVLDLDGDPAVLPTALDPFDHLLLMQTGLMPPPAAIGLQPMPAAGTIPTP